MPRNPNLTLDQFLDEKRRAEASKTASAILGKARFGASGKGAITPTRNTTPASRSPTSATKSRIQKSTSIPGLPVSQQTARSLAGNKLFTALHPDAVRVVPSPPAGPSVSSTPSGPKHGNGGRLSRPGSKRPSPVRAMGGNGGNNGRSNQNQNNGGQQANRGNNSQNNNQSNNGQNNNQSNGAQNSKMNIRGSAPANQMTIKGAAGPAVLQASNFAPGTTAEDIRHHMSTFGNVKSCLVLTAYPTVIAEIVFETMQQGKDVVERFNGVWADGRMLSVTFKTTPPIANLSHLTNPQPIPDPFKEREEADRRRREQNIHYQDGTYGVQAPPIYSDDLLRKGRGRFNMLQ
ncbi:hypothetical protein FPQ18DRAFT_320440 [Pyronema domesticum]|uniref:Similar to Uncharacterized RNA-binding protein C126.11c acc. no. O94403 n=1 Tax=Pyronema omphalodes (strain CBS 100304) TaxID=1076935 RepID=U4LU40_PYROM|nr:hypothetical protein FPQ18DRAFT_320440 [Pyronema domesticum]CCX31326.1 Similar to Uncharacterized RNA-binding protein C126.11c; acc. no. O94403 [Pyronema omphalodes CBS 100304]